MHVRLIRCLARAVAKHGVKFLLDLAPGGNTVYDMAVEAWEAYCKDDRVEALRAEVQELAQAPAEQVRTAVLAAVGAEAAALPAKVQQAMTSYLSQVPAMIRRSLRRPSDPTGTTVPANQSFASPEDLMAFLPPRPPRFKAGDRPIAGVDWVLEEPLGVGGFGEVWKARHAHMRKAPVTLKFCLDTVGEESLKREVKILNQVMQHGRHPGIVPLLDTHLSADPPCLVYKFVEGGDLAGLIQEMHSQGQMTPAKANRLLLRLAEIVASAHQANPPIVHDDLKPANVLVRRGADKKLSLFVTDFGIGGLAATQAARESRQPTRNRHELLTQAARGAYTPVYACPEQMRRRGGEALDPRDDVHALGVIWYQLLTGDLGMFSMPSDWREQLEKLGLEESLVKLLGSCIASTAANRPASAVVLAEQLKAAVTPRKPLAPVLVGLGLLGLLVIACVVVSVIVGGRGSGEPVEVSKPKSDPPVIFNPQPGTRAGEVITNPLSMMKFAWIPPGKFTMGSPPGEKGHQKDETSHQVTLTKGFYMGVTEVTQAQWQAVMGSNPSAFKGDDRPVETVSWDECQEFCKKLGQRDGKRYRLPTEAEWEYACRAGMTTAYHNGNDLDALKRVGLCSYDGVVGSAKETSPARQLQPNAWVLYDMHGNVWEWCQDWYGPYPIDDIKDPQGAVTGGACVLRGGSWNDTPSRCRSAYRNWYAPSVRGSGIGCRVVLCLNPTVPEPKSNPTVSEPKSNPTGIFNPQPGTRAGEVITNPLSMMKFAWIPPGTFTLGSPPGEEGRQENETSHQVTLTKGFYMGVTEVTQAQWQAVMGSNPSAFKGDDRPVETVSWDECQEFCKKLGQRDGKRHRLPTEAEWEYACRAGTTTAYHSGNDLDALKRVGWCSYDGVLGSAKETSPARQLQPNAWVLYDMHGNVREWCQDWYWPYSTKDITDPRGSNGGDFRVLRGGSWNVSATNCRAASRSWLAPSDRSGNAGCRVVLCLD